MKCLLTGLQDMNFNRNGDEVDGVKLHYVCADPNTHGKMATNQFVKRHFYDSFGIPVKDMIEIIGTEVDIDFNSKGKICALTV